MSETAPNANEQESKSVSPYEGLDSATLAAIAEARDSIDEESATKTLDLRSKVREILEGSGVDGAFKRAYNMNNGELNQFVDGAAQEQTGRRVAEVQSIIDAYDSSDSFADRRTAIREALIAAGHEDAFKQIYNMNNLELTSFVEAARAEHQELTTPSESEALEGAYDEYEKQEGTPYDVDKGRVKDTDLARDMAVDEENISKVGEFIRNNPESPETQRLIDELKDIMRQINEALNASRTADNLGDLGDLPVSNGSADNLDDLGDIGTPRDPREANYVDKDTALNEAYDEYATPERGGEAYDIDKGRVKDVEKAHEDAIAEYGTAERGGEAYDIDKGREKDVEKAHEDAIAEYGTAERGGEAYDVDKGRVKDIAEAEKQAYTEKAERKWYRRAWRRFQYAFTPQGRQELFDRAAEQKDKFKDSKTSTKIAIGVVAAAAVGIASYAAWRAGAFDMFSGDNTPDSNGGGNGGTGAETNPGVDAAVTPETPAVDAPAEAFDFSDAARTVDPGEGWFQTMREAGITDASQQADLLKNDGLMNQLKDMGLAYRAPDLGGWGIRMPSNGVMPQEALDLIKSTASK